jgi:hypothetical protein
MLKKVGIAAVAAFSVSRITNFAQSAVEAADVQLKAEAKLLTALKGRKDVQQALIEQAGELQSKTLYGDEQTIEAASMVAPFVAQEEALKRVIPLIQDFATAKGMDLKNAADLIGKTLGSETNALSRYGLEVEGAVGSTQRLETLTRSLSDAFGGQAQAAAKAGLGEWQQFQNTMGDVAESLGVMIIPLLNKAGKKLAETLNPQTIEKFKKKGAALLDNLDDIADAGKVVVTVFLSYKAALVAAAAQQKITFALGKIQSFLKATQMLTRATQAQILVSKMLAAVNPYAAIGIALGALLGAMALFNKKAEKSKKVTSELEQEFAKEKSSLEALLVQLRNTNSGTEERALLIQKINDKYDTNLKNIKNEKKFLQQIDSVRGDIINKMKREMLLKSQEKRIQDNLSQQQVLKGMIATTEAELERLNQLDSVAGANAARERLDQQIGSLNKLKNEIKNIAKDTNEELEGLFGKQNQQGGAGKVDVQKTKRIVEVEVIEPPAMPEMLKDDWDPFSTATSSGNATRLSAMMAELNSEFSKAGEFARLYGDEMTLYADKQTILKESIQQLISEGYSAEGEAIQALIAMQNELAESQGKNIDKMKLMQAFSAELGDSLMNTAKQGAESFSEMGSNMLNTIRQVITGFIAKAVAGAVSKAIGESVLPFPLNIIAAPTAAAMATTAFNSLVPQFADGGMVYGPTMGLMGEYPGARSNPEVIAPLDKLRGILRNDSSPQGGQVEFEIKGDRLVGVLNNHNRRTSRQR